MPKVYITDEVNDGYTADVLPSGALKSSHENTYALINSGTGTGVISTANIILHKVVVAASANLGFLYIGSNAASSDAAPGAASSASAVAIIDLAARGVYDLDAYVPAVCTYRLSGLNCNGITVTYETKSFRLCLVES
jgi:hypothetical protein